MKAVILAAGEGKRMLPLTRSIPKPLLRIGSRTILDGIFEALPNEADTVVVVVGYLKKKIQQHLGNRYQGKNIRYVTQPVLNGTATALLSCKDLFVPCERFLVLYGDEMPRKEEIKSCLEHEYSWLCHTNDMPQQSGIATIDPSGRIVEVIEKPEKPASNMTAAGLMLINADIFKYKPVLHTNGEYYLTALMNQFTADHDVYAVIGDKRPGLTSPDDLARVEQWSKSPKYL